MLVTLHRLQSHLGYIADSELMEKDSIDYPDEPKDDDEDPKEDLEEDHTNYPVDREDGDDEPSDDDDDDDDTDDEDEEPTEDEEEEHLAPADPFAVPVVDPIPSAGDTEAFETDKVEDVGYVRALQASEHRMMTSIEEVNLRVSYQAQRTAYETELHKVRQAYLSFEAQNRALLARLKTLETHMSRMEWQRQRAEDDAIRQMMRIHVLEARAQIDTVEDTGRNPRNLPITQMDASRSSGGGLKRPVQPARVCSYTDFMNCQPLNFKGTKGIVGLSQWLEKMESTKKVDKYISGLPDNIHGNVMFARPKTLDDAIELANDLMDQKLHTYAERQNDNKRRLMISPRTIYNPIISNM
ncbi:hypothetical protein Tco_0701571 [Tanacetum coccineum]